VKQLFPALQQPWASNLRISGYNVDTDFKSHENMVMLNIRMASRMNVQAVLLAAALLFSACGQQSSVVKDPGRNPYYSNTDTTRLHVSNEEWRKLLPADLYAVSRMGETEKAFTGKYWNAETKGTYYCAVCGNKLFRSDAKFASTCGWPSFFEPARKGSVIYRPDTSLEMQRTEVICARCDSHLGHIFDDGPPPTHKRFCMNSVSLDFQPDK
jgi:peptide-methionine (R)-S-oxide reductase